MANITIRLTPQVDKYLATAKNKSAAANRAIESWIVTEKRARRSIAGVFASSELTAILDVLNGTIIDPAYADSIAHEFEDGCALDGLDKKWHLDKFVTLAKMEKLSHPEWIILAQWAATFWENPEQDMGAYVKSLSCN